MGVISSGETDSHCAVFHMDKDENRSVVFYFKVCPTSIGHDERPANPDDYEKCINPPRVTIKSPSNNSVCTIGDTITFSGSASDIEDGTLTGSSLAWTSDIDGQIGTGNDVSRNDLSVGYHNITLSATDSQGDEGSDSVYIFINDTERKVWTFETGDGVESSPTVSNGYVYVGSNDGNIYCLDAQSGDKKWDVNIGGNVKSSPVVSGGYVYVGSSNVYFGDSNFYCLDAETGDEIWSYAFIDSDSSPAVSDEYVYFGSKSIHCIDAQNGDVVWETSYLDTFISDLTTPAISDGSIYVGGSMWTGSKKGKVYGLNAQNGENIWEYETVAEVYSSPAVSGGCVYVGSDDGKVYCLDAKTGDEKWNYQTEGSVRSSPSISGGYVYVGSDDGSIYRLDAQTGVKDIAFYIGSGVRSSPAVSGGYVYVGNYIGAVFGLDFNARKMDWVFKIEYSISSPSLSNGYVYVGSSDSKVYCLKAAEGDTGSWPMFKYNPARTGAK